MRTRSPLLTRSVVNGSDAPSQLDGQDVEADAHARSVRTRVVGREITEDPVLDLVALRIDADRFSDQEIAVALDIRITDEEDDALIRQRRRQPRQQQ